MGSDAEKLAAAQNATDNTNSLGFVGLTTLVVTTCVGAGIFSLAGDLAAGGANTAAVLAGWPICFVGVFALAKTFSGLTAVRPEFSGGIYAYAHSGFGEYVGFGSAWGYWMSACLNNAGYAIMLFNALSYFFPQLGGGNSPVSVLLASCFLWLIAFLLTHGVRLATGVNLVITLAKLVPLALFILCVVLLTKFDPAVFTSNFWGEPGGPSFVEQLRGTMISLVWLFVGLEGAVVVSGRARDPHDVSRATTFGFVLVVVFYILICVLSLGILPREELAVLSTPSLAGVFEKVIGPAGAVLVNGGVVVSLMGTMLGYLTFAAETSYQAASRGLLPARLAATDSHGTSVTTVLVSAGITQAFLVLSIFSEGTYQFFYTCSVYAILVPYTCAAAYYARIAWKAERMDMPLAPSLISARIAGTLALAYTAFLIWSSGMKGLTVVAIAVAPGTILYLLMRVRAKKSLLPTLADKVFAAIVAAAVIATVVVNLLPMFVA
ncbi:amino acid permease [Paratractidigestivibacter sp.]|uniref:amino acid permease n=1 Tax=Paratractidigestivibacter sp. TaxID=2847316 RepID=UPI002AC8AA3D|nr:amino acid permease [Paratractidigestivibacter sp.]